MPVDSFLSLPLTRRIESYFFPPYLCSLVLSHCCSLVLFLFALSHQSLPKASFLSTFPNVALQINHVTFLSAFRRKLALIHNEHTAEWWGDVLGGIKQGWTKLTALFISLLRLNVVSISAWWNLFCIHEKWIWPVVQHNFTGLCFPPPPQIHQFWRKYKNTFTLYSRVVLQLDLDVDPSWPQSFCC